MNFLPDLVLLEIFKYLEFRDLISVSEVCTNLNRLSSSDKLWKALCRDVWLLKSKCCKDSFDERTWKEVFILQYQLFGKYLSCYKKVKSRWIALETYLEQNCPEIFKSLNPGLEEKVLDEFEKLRKVILPLDYKLSYLLHNGQNCQSPGRYGIFGGIFLPQESFFCSGFCPFEIAVESFSSQCLFALPITHTQSLKLSVAQLVLPKDLCHKQVAHKTELIAFQDGQYCSIADSFADWFSQYVDKLTDNHFCIVQGNILLYDKATEVSKKTNNITVSVRWSYNHTFNTVISASNLYTYHITMSMAAEAPNSESCKLLTRHWDIKDETGDFHVVDGDGVVGYYPVMRPGSTFSWRSSTTFKTNEGGSMKGYFTMQYLSNPSLILHVVCPEFKMRRPPLLEPKWTERKSHAVMLWEDN